MTQGCFEDYKPTGPVNLDSSPILCGCRHSLFCHARDQFTHQRQFLPEDKRFLVLPIQTLGLELEIEVPEDTRKDDAHLVVGQVLSDAVSRAHGEGLEDVALVSVKWRGWVGVDGGEPALRDEVRGAVEVAGGEVGAGLVDGDFGLHMTGLGE